MMVYYWHDLHIFEMIGFGVRDHARGDPDATCILTTAVFVMSRSSSSFFTLIPSVSLFAVYFCSSNVEK